MKKILFFDDYNLCYRKNTLRKYGKPKFVKSFTEDYSNLGLPIIFKDTQIAPYIMYYTAKKKIIEKDTVEEKKCLCMATSNDCINWKSYKNKLIFNNKYMDNQIIPCGEIEEIITIVRTFNNEFYFYGCSFDWGNTYDIKIVQYKSIDGLILIKQDKCMLNPNGCEPLGGSFFNPITKDYTFIIRPNWAERRCAISFSKDLKNYTPLKIVMQVDSLDMPCSEIYGMPCYADEGYYIGFLSIYETADEDWGMVNKFRHGHLDVQLAYSFDGAHFQRSLRENFIDRGEPDCKWYGMVVPYSAIKVNDKIFIAASCTQKEHGYFEDDNSASISIFEIKKDRFIGLESINGWAYVRSRTLIFKSSLLTININIPYGEFYVRLIDAENNNVIKGYDFSDFDMLKGDSVSYSLTWKNKGIDDLILRPINLEIKYCNGILYCIEGDFIVIMTTMQMRRYKKYNIEPSNDIF